MDERSARLRGTYDAAGATAAGAVEIVELAAAALVRANEMLAGGRALDGARVEDPEYGDVETMISALARRLAVQCVSRPKFAPVRLMGSEHRAAPAPDAPPEPPAARRPRVADARRPDPDGVASAMAVAGDALRRRSAVVGGDDDDVADVDRANEAALRARRPAVETTADMWAYVGKLAQAQGILEKLPTDAELDEPPAPAAPPKRKPPPKKKAARAPAAKPKRRVAWWEQAALDAAGAARPKKRASPAARDPPKPAAPPPRPTTPEDPWANPRDVVDWGRPSSSRGGRPARVPALPGDDQGSTRERNSQLQRLRSRPFSTRFG